MTRMGGLSRPTAFCPEARGLSPVESGLITYSVLQVVGLALATPWAPSCSSFPSLPRGSRSGTPVAGQAPARSGLPGLTI